MPITPNRRSLVSTSHHERERSARRLAVTALVVVAAVLTWLAISSPLAVAPLRGVDLVHAGAGRVDGAVGRAGGDLPGGASLHDDVPAITGLDPDLLAALRSAAADAADDDVEFVVNSGWRSPALQQQLLDDAVAEYGSAEEAARWVSTPTTSEHVHGDAVDIGPFDATYWLLQHGAAYGLCQIYGNESWHYELRPAAVTDGCPEMYADPTEDPRTQG